MSRTKIICTMGPSVASFEKILELIDAGMNVARINFSHGTHEEHRRVIQNLKRARDEKGVPLAIMADTKGPEIRLGDVKNGALPVEAGQKIVLTSEARTGDESGITLTPPKVIQHVTLGMRVLFDDGYISGVVREKKGSHLVVEIQNPGGLKSHKSVTFPEAPIDLPAMTPKDITDLAFVCENDLDYVAGSFIRSADHVHAIKKLLDSHGQSGIQMIAKIENGLGVAQFDSILAAADGIMVARGDLGVELPLEQVPHLQKMMIRKCCQASKPVVTATQMLESMIKNPRPTRAEVSDVANAIYDSTSSVMLSGETAVGAYPIDAVKMMKKISETAEDDFQFREFFTQQTWGSDDVSTSVARAAVQTAYSANAKAIITITSSGSTPKLISRFRPQMPIFALTLSEKVYHQMAFLWGVTPIKTAPLKNVQEAIAQASRLLKPGDLVVVTTGSPFLIKGTTNTMIVERID